MIEAFVEEFDHDIAGIVDMVDVVMYAAAHHVRIGTAVEMSLPARPSSTSLPANPEIVSLLMPPATYLRLAIPRSARFRSA